MKYPILQRGSKGAEVQRFQHELNKVGAMLVPDGDFGSGTVKGVNYAESYFNLPVSGKSSDALWQNLIEQNDPFPLLGSEGVAFIAREETGGLRYYNEITQWPHYPGVSSGITIGVGYDLRFNSVTDFKTVWSTELSAKVITELSNDIGKAGTKKRSSELKAKGITVPFKAAWHVFIRKTLPRFYDETVQIYPSLDSLPLLCRSALVSIVFNRGNSLQGSRRMEMRNIRDILAKASVLPPEERKTVLVSIEDEIISMQRLWGIDSGLYKRRQGEANLWRRGVNELA